MKNLPTTAGHTNRAIATTISKVFGLFELNYGNQYHRAISSEAKEKSIKRLWMSSLGHFSIEVISEAAETIIKQQHFMPTLSVMLETCQDVMVGSSCPDELTAYEEACASTYPKNHYSWSHPAVYFAGARTGWQRLETQAESITLPIFKQRFKQVKAEIAQGQEFTIPKTSVQPKIPTQNDIVAKEDMGQYLDSIKSILESN